MECEWSGALVEQVRARCNIVWVAPFCSGDKKKKKKKKRLGTGWSLFVYDSAGQRNTKHPLPTGQEQKLNTHCGHTTGGKRQENFLKKEHRTIPSAKTEANYHSHCTRRHELDWLASSGGVDSKTEQSVTKKTRCSGGREETGGSKRHADWLNCLCWLWNLTSGISACWRPRERPSTSDSSRAADRPGISTLESGGWGGRLFPDLHSNCETASLIYNRRSCMNRICGLAYGHLSICGENKVANTEMNFRLGLCIGSANTSRKTYIISMILLPPRAWALAGPCLQHVSKCAT